MSNISQVTAREVLDSRGNPTVEVDVRLSDGSWGHASVPSGASTGTHEAIELRDGNPQRFRGRGVMKAIGNIREFIEPAIVGKSAYDQEAIDALLKEIDGTPNKSRLGANAIIGVSMAVANAAAQSQGKPLYKYLSHGEKPTLPVPLLNIINGGRHAENSTDFQEFMVAPIGFDTFSQALQCGVEIYQSLMDSLRNRALGTAVGDEGGFAPALHTNRQAVDLVMEAIEKAGYRPGVQCFIALDVAANELSVRPGRYSLSRDEENFPAGRLIDIYENWIEDYPIISIEDGLAEDDWNNWCQMTDKLGSKVQIVGDDIYTTNTERIQEGINVRASNAVLIKLNQIGTVTETMQAIDMTKNAGWGTIISHRSGETENTMIADLAVGTNAGQIKAGAPARGERTAKYNRLLRIEQELGDKAEYAGRKVFEKYLQNW